MSQDRRKKHAQNAATGILATAGGEVTGQLIAGRPHTGRAGKVSGVILSRGTKAVGIPLAATGVVGASRGRGRTDKVDHLKLPEQVARRTVELPRPPKTKGSQRAKDVGTATLAGVGGGILSRRLGTTRATRAALGTAGSIGTASSTLYGRQKGRERKAALAKADRDLKRQHYNPVGAAATGAAVTPLFTYGMAPGVTGRTLRRSSAIGAGVGAAGALHNNRRRRQAQRRAYSVAKAEEKRPQKMIKIPAPTVNDTVEDWRIHNQRRKAANANMAATTLGAVALAARAPKLIRPKTGSAKLVRLRERGEKASNVLGGTAAGGYVYGGATSYKTQRHDLAVQRRRLTERDKALQGVRKDRFLDTHRQHISPSAEAGYEYLRRGRNKKAGMAAFNAAITGVNVHAARHGGKIARPLGIAAAGLTGTNTVREARGAKRWNDHMKKIKAKAYERAARGEYGRGREVQKDELAKALVRVRIRPAGLPYPKGLRRTPALRAGSVRRTASGGRTSYRGSFG